MTNESVDIRSLIKREFEDVFDVYRNGKEFYDENFKENISRSTYINREIIKRVINVKSKKAISDITKRMISQEIVEMLGNTYRKGYFLFVGDTRGYWVYKHNRKLHKNIELVLEWVIEKYYDIFNIYPSSNDVLEVKKRAKRLYHIERTMIDNEETLNHINFYNNHLSLDNYELENKEFNEFFQIPFSYNKDAKLADTVMDMFKMAARNQENPEAWIDDIQEIFGYCLTKRIDKKIMFWFIDAVEPTANNQDKRGNNLKSTVQDCLTICLGEGNWEEQALQHTSTNRFAKQGIANAQVVTFPDLSEKELENTGDIKKMVSDRRFTYEEKHGAPNIKLVNTKKYLYSMQRIPWIKQKLLDEAFAGRIKMMLFKYTLELHEIDSNWFEREVCGNVEVIEGIIAWAVEGLKRLYTRGYFLGCDAKDNYNYWRYEVDYVYRFVKDWGVKSNSKTSLDVKKVRAYFELYCEAHGSEIILTRNKFNQRMNASKHPRIRVRVRANETKYIYQNFDLDFDNIEVQFARDLMQEKLETLDEWSR